MGAPLLQVRRISYVLDSATLTMTCQRKHYNSVTDTIWIRIMPSELQNCHQEWIQHEKTYWQVEGLLTWPETRNLHFFVGTSKSNTHIRFIGIMTDLFVIS